MIAQEEFAAGAGGIDPAGLRSLQAEDNERSRIGRELHDSTTQYLVAAQLGVSRVLQGDGLSDEDRRRLEDVQASLSIAQQEMRAFAFLLHPPELREHGLAGAIEGLCVGFARRTGLEVEVATGLGPASLSTDVQHALFRVCQEALMNVHRHAFARHVAVTLQAARGSVFLEIRDDGIGIDGAGRFELAGVGISAMRERMLSIGGQLTLAHLEPGLAVRAEAPATIRRRPRHVQARAFTRDKAAGAVGPKRLPAASEFVATAGEHL